MSLAIHLDYLTLPGLLSRRAYWHELEWLGRQGPRLSFGREGRKPLQLEADARTEAELSWIFGAQRPAIDGVEDLRRGIEAWLDRAGFYAPPFVEWLVEAASLLGASDLHLAPQGRVSLRLDGVLHDLGTLDEARAARTRGRLKVLSELGAHLSDRPQEGRASIGGAWIRTSFVPGVGGESVTLRLFDRLKAEATLEALGFDPQALTTLQTLLAQPHGVLLIAGASASGKTTTMYTALRSVVAASAGTVRALAVEDPVEYSLDEVVQLEAEPQRGVDGAALLRSALRQDVDLLAVGEVRDPDTAALLIRAGLTGHRVLATIHAGTPAEAWLRLLEAGVPEAQLQAAINGVLVQALLRRRCCAEGCEACHQTGYAGRVALVDVRPREALQGDAGVLRARAAQLVAEGVTDEAEVLRVLGPAP